MRGPSSDDVQFGQQSQCAVACRAVGKIVVQSEKPIEPLLPLAAVDEIEPSIDARQRLFEFSELSVFR